MRISSLTLKKFRRFNSLEIKAIPETARLVILAGPNGSGKSSLFDAFLLKYRMKAGYGWRNDPSYYERSSVAEPNIGERIKISMHNDALLQRGSLYVRSSYRHDPEFITNTLQRSGPILDTVKLNRLIDMDATVADNYQRLASQAMEDVFVNEEATTTIGQFRDRVIGECREPLRRLFPDLTLTGVGNPLEQGTFQFEKGNTKNFDYKNLSGGEKAAFDLLLDFVIKTKNFNDTIYCIDEPEAHINTKLQGRLLEELMGLLPESSQLWIATHSIGMMRKARELYTKNPEQVVFLDFSEHDFDHHISMEPSKPTRRFWAGVLNVALDDLAALVVPSEIVLCEGNPSGTRSGKNAEHDARIYSTIFSNEFPEVTFISAGNSKEVAGDYIGLASALPKLASGIKIRRLIDRDDHAPSDIANFKAKKVAVLSRRNIESYLYDDEVLTALCSKFGQSHKAQALLEDKREEMRSSIARGNAPDDLKPAAPAIYVRAKRRLGLTAVGNDQMSFARNTLSQLIKPEMAVYDELKKDIFIS